MHHGAMTSAPGPSALTPRCTAVTRLGLSVSVRSRSTPGISLHSEEGGGGQGVEGECVEQVNTRHEPALRGIWRGAGG